MAINELGDVMKVNINVDERYPEYQIDEDDHQNCDITDELFYEYKRIMANFDDMQQKLKSILHESMVNKAKDVLAWYVGMSNAERIAEKFDPDTILQNVIQFDKQAEDIYNRSRDGVRPPDEEISAAKKQMVRNKILETFTVSL